MTIMATRTLGMTIMAATLTMMRPTKDFGSDDLGDIVNRDAEHDDHDGADEARMSVTFTRTLTPLRHVKRLSL